MSSTPPSTPSSSRTVSGSQSAAHQKLGDLRKQLANQSKATTDRPASAALRTQGSRGDLKTTAAETQRIAEELFRRAPDDFLSRSSVQTLLEIAEQCRDAVADISASAAPFSVRIFNPSSESDRAQLTTLVSVMNDRPFIVDTVTEFLRSHQHNIRVFLHPVLTIGSRKLSLIYIETDRISDSASLQALLAAFNNLFTDLISVTHDFASMLSRIDDTREEFRVVNTEAKEPPEDSLRSQDQAEIVSFLHWLSDGGFVFLGALDWVADSDLTQFRPENPLGLFRSVDHSIVNELNDTKRDAESLAQSDSIFHFSKVLLESPIHRRARMDLVAVRLPGTGAMRLRIFVGLLTSKAVAQEASSVPIIRQKLRKIIALEGATPNSHDYKAIVSIFDSTPKSVILRYSVEIFRRDIQLILSLQGRNETRVTCNLDSLRRFATLMVVMPRERFSQEVRRKIQDYIEKELSVIPRSSEYRLSVTDEPYIRISFFVPNPSLEELSIDTAKIQTQVATLTSSWSDQVLELLSARIGPRVALRLGDYYCRAFPEDYRASTSPTEAVTDIEFLEKLSADNPVEIAINELTGRTELYDIRIYKRSAGLTLSQMVPLLENLGLSVENEYTTHLGEQQTAWAAIYSLYVTPRSQQDIPDDIALTYLLPGLKAVLLGEAENDRLNGLLIRPGLSFRQIALLRCLTHYLFQIRAVTSKESAYAALTSYPDITRTLFDCFTTKFDPAIRATPSDRIKDLSQLCQHMISQLKDVKDLNQDRAFRSLINCLDSVVRTNYFQQQGLTTSIKVDCSKVTRMPSPRPAYEIFVHSPKFSGVHLRGGRVARGGLRWSERQEDYRTEVLGLLKTQMVKNSIIVPVGAKGGFVIHTDNVREITPDEVKETYKCFIRALLQITDNIAPDGSVAHPRDVVIHDEADPYFVVAADKGTATFSDIANDIATNEFNFWLSDAFASGGSNGYDHKKLAITAKGGWESVRRHFAELGIDPNTDEISVVGIGDMSGDVFGNGMLLSHKIKLIAAFNHKHVFLDPNPDPESSFAERKRLFELPRSQWSDYNNTLISPGGGVFLRTDKEIPITAELRRSLSVESSTLSGEELIKAILRAPVDLLWNGGIGTYVKSSSEDNIAAGDRTNDDVRTDANELRVKVVGEGGNLGFTQRARIEFAFLGGRINTDAIDNSGGVDMSDHEVNLKILLRTPLSQEAITADERNSLLASLAPKVSFAVTDHNRTQNIAISIAVKHTRQKNRLRLLANLVHHLEQTVALHRPSENLPSEDEFIVREKNKLGLTRPELAVILSYTKRWLSESITTQELPTQTLAEQALIEYFPDIISSRFKREVLDHPLRKEIIATQIANLVVDRFGPTFVFGLVSDLGAAVQEILSATLVADRLIQGKELHMLLVDTDLPGKSEAFLGAIHALSNVVEGIVRWLHEQRPRTLSWDEIVQRYENPLRILLAEIPTHLVDSEHKLFDQTCQSLISNGFSATLAHRLASLAYITSYLDVVEIAHVSKCDIDGLAQLYLRLAAELQVHRLVERQAAVETTDPLEETALRAVASNLRESVRRIARNIVKEQNSVSKDAYEAYMARRESALARHKSSVAEFSSKPPSLAALIVLSQQLALLAN